MPQVSYWIGPVTGAFVTLGMWLVGGWVVFMIVRGRQTEVKALTEYRQKVLEKFGSATEFTEFLQTEEGKKFLEPLAPVDPKQRIIRTTQWGVVTAVFGAVMLAVSIVMSFYDPRTPFNEPWPIFLGSLILAVGSGFLIAARVSYHLSKSWHLLPDEKAALPPAQTPAAGTA